MVETFDPEKKRAEADAALREVFFDLFGVPYSWAKTLASMDGHVLGDLWRERLDFFEHNILKPVDDGDMDIT